MKENLFWRFTELWLIEIFIGMDKEMSIDAYQKLAEKILNTLITFENDKVFRFGVDVTDFNFYYEEVGIHITLIFKEAFTGDESEYIYSRKSNILTTLNGFLPNKIQGGLKPKFTFSASTKDLYFDRFKQYYDIKKEELVKTIDNLTSPYNG